MQDDALLGTFRWQCITCSCLEAIRAGDEYGASYLLHVDNSAARGVVWLATGMFRSSTPSASETRYLPMRGIFIPLPS